MKKITKMSVVGSMTEEALIAAFGPFGSLTEGVDGRALAQAMIRWVNAEAEHVAGLAGLIVGHLWSTATEQVTTVELGAFEAVLRTPTSGTKIRLQRDGGGYSLEVDFGPKGSESRAVQILLAAERAGVRFNAYSGGGQIPRALVIAALRQTAEMALEGSVNLKGTGYYTEEYREALEAGAREDVEFFSRLQ